MKKQWILVPALVLILVTACTGTEEADLTPEALEAYTPMVSVTGEMVPATWATVSAQAGGRVAEVLVEVGDEVAEGDVVARLEAAEVELAVQQAEVALESARAQLAQIEAAARPEEVAVAEAGVAVAEANLARVLEGSDDQQIIAARAELANAEAELALAQRYYDQVSWRPEISMLPQSLQLEQATNVYQAAQARYNDLLWGPSAAEIQQAEAQVQQAQAQLALAQAGATTEARAVARAQVAAAEVALEQAQLQVQRTIVRAPFAGTVGLLEVRTGEIINPSQPLLTLGDLTTMRVETTDLDEIDVALVQVGQTGTVTFDALPDRTFTGRITRIAPMDDPQAAGVNYAVVLALDELDPAIRWGMTAFIDIEVGD